MPLVSRAQSIPANSTAAVDLSPFQRFGLRGGAIRVRAAIPVGSTLGDILGNLTIGSDQVARDSVVQNSGTVTRETPAMEGFGAAADPITLTFQNTTAGAIVVNVVADIQNA